MNKSKYNLWAWVKRKAESKMREAYLEPNGGCDSAYPRCKQWESLGNKIYTIPLEEGSDKRTCSNCGNVWISIFTPAGFLSVDTTNS